MRFKSISWGILLLSLFLAALVFGGEDAHFVVYLIGCWAVGAGIASAACWLARRF